MLDRGIRATVKIPEEVDVDLDGNTVVVSGPNGKLSRNFDLRGIRMERDGDCLIVKSDSSKRRHRAALGTITSHIENMIRGTKEVFSSKLRVVYSHFPISVNVRGGKVEIENFIGEEKSRFAEIVGDTDVEVEGEEILVSGADKEAVGQTAANIEQAAQVKDRDPRVFQDGIYMVERP